MDRHQKIALQMLGEATRNTCDIYVLSGRGNRHLRQAIMWQLTGEKVPMSSCGVNAIAREFAEQLKIAQTSNYEVSRQLRYMNDTSNKVWTGERVLKEMPLVRVRGHGFARVNHPWALFEPKTPVSEQPVCVTYGVHNTEMMVDPALVAQSLNRDVPLEPLNKRKV